MATNDNLLLWMLIREHNFFLDIISNPSHCRAKKAEAETVVELIRGILHEYSTRTRTTPFYYDLSGKMHKNG